jgi:hypothetical protein
MSLIRHAAVSGLFYPAETDVLAGDVRRLLDAVPKTQHPQPKAIIAPHAGYIYSGPVAASVYARLRAFAADITRVVLIGPSHRLAFPGLAVPSAEFFETPLGRIPVDHQAVARLLTLSDVSQIDAAHAQEHSLEVHLPFLQSVLDHFVLVPVVVGQASEEQIADALEEVWGGADTLIVVSSDLSHYLNYDDARDSDDMACRAILRREAAAVDPAQACGRAPIAGLLQLALRHDLSVELVDRRNSGDTAGPRDRVVGYASFAFTSPGTPAAQQIRNTRDKALRHDAARLLGLARQAIAAVLEGTPPPTPVLAPPLDGQGACFVTLHKNGQLRGCIGSPVAWRKLGEDIVDNARKAAFEDPRFPPLAAREWADLDLSLSVLSPPQPMQFADEDDLLGQLRPRIDGLVIQDGVHRALFLPSVWDQLPVAADFLAHLKRKAGLPPDHWSATLTAQRFTALELGSADVGTEDAEGADQ